MSPDGGWHRTDLQDSVGSCIPEDLRRVLLTPCSPTLLLTCQAELRQHEGAADGCQEPGQGFVASKQLQTSPALLESRILLGAGKANTGAKAGCGWLPPIPARP